MPLFASRLKHDELVTRIAVLLAAKGYDVRARVEGWFDPPDYIFEYRPDVVAKKEGRYYICEVDKGDIDWPKIMALQRFAQEKPNFELLVISLSDPNPIGTVEHIFKRT